ncbi:MAG: hypothetical protein M1832_004331 [Thelocarpon impressellum]|nr:MAG: hypothetical protein M1832_004331 [Thelocarpon impressellum]
MESQPAKRRKTSPTTSVPVDAPTTPPRGTPRRASFLSPTRASLARFNPTLLPRPASVGPGETKRPASRDGAPLGLRAPSLPPPASAPFEEVTVSRRGSAVGPTTPSGGGGLATPAPGTVTSLPRRTARSTAASGGMASSPRRPPRSSSPSKGAVAPSVEPIGSDPSAQLAQDVAAAASSRGDESGGQTQTRDERRGGTRRSARLSGDRPASSSPMVVGDDGEPELPPTPTQLGLPDPVMSRAPAGLFNSPGKRPRRRRGLGGKAMSSPLKGSTKGEKQPTRTRAGKAAGDQAEAEASRTKQLLLDQLQAELRGLREDIQRREFELAAASGREDSAEAEAETEDLIALLISSNDESTLPPPSQSKAFSLSLSAFLPFSARPAAAATVPSLPVSDSGELPSHRPLDLANPLPYLQIFTPLTFKSTTTVLPPSSPPSSLLQHHLITATSPLHLLSATLSLTVDVATHSVEGLAIQALSPWADPELGPWLRARASGANEAVGKDIAGVCWALGRFWEVAERRARFWTRCERAFPQLLDSVPSKPAPAPPPEDDEDSDDGKGEARYTRRALLTHISRRHITLRREATTLHLGWEIVLDWTGEAEASIHASASLPHRASRRDGESPQQVDALFATLLAQQGLWRATRAVVGVLFP